MYKLLISLFLCLLMPFAFANGPLSPDKGFELSSYMKDKKLHLVWHMAPHHYLYREQIKITTKGNSFKIDEVSLPVGINKQDEIHGQFQAYMENLTVPVSIAQYGEGPLNLEVRYQGCSTDGFCYPPIKKEVRVEFPKGQEPLIFINDKLQTAKPLETSNSLFEGSYIVIILSFLGMGLLLSFTPCVLPMVPILSGIIIGQGRRLTTASAFFHSLAYVMGMSLTYAGVGMMVALAGKGIQAEFQKPWVILSFSGLFVVLAMSLFGFYELQLPSGMRNRLNNISNKQKSGTYIGAFVMGALASLIVSPCVSAPLVGVLAYIANTGNIVLGGIALWSLGFGMGIPLLLIGMSAGKLLPKAGAWMESVKRVFGILLIGFAIWLASRVLPESIILALWGVLAAIAAIAFGVFKKDVNKLSRVFSIVLLIYGSCLGIGSVMGNTSVLHPFNSSKIMMAEEKLPFVTPKSKTEFENSLAIAHQNHRPVMIDFYADWCVSCVLMDRHVFAGAKVKQLLQDYVLVRADVTQNNDFDKALLKQFNVVAPPTMIFLSPEGIELTTQRIVGEVNAKEFLTRMQSLNLSQK